MNTDLKILVEIFHKGNLIAHVEKETNDDVLSLVNEGAFYLTNRINDCSNTAVKQVFSKK